MTTPRWFVEATRAGWTSARDRSDRTTPVHPVAVQPDRQPEPSTRASSKVLLEQKPLPARPGDEDERPVVDPQCPARGDLHGHGHNQARRPSRAAARRARDGLGGGMPMSRVRLLGALEIAGAIGVIVPWATGILTLLTPLAAWGLAAVQVGGIWTRDRTPKRWERRQPPLPARLRGGHEMASDRPPPNARDAAGAHARPQEITRYPSARAAA